MTGRGTLALSTETLLLRIDIQRPGSLRCQSSFLNDLDKETVNFTPNFDDSRKEPVVLPAAWPNLLVNGSSGIAVGMATKIPPHNLKEVVSALQLLIQNPDASIKDLMKKVPAPDFPTGGVIIGQDGLKNAYETGRGSITIRCVSDIETVNKNKEAIIVREIPYEIKKSDLITKIAELVNHKKIEGISEIRDESDRRGMRIVIILRKEANAQIILNQLYKRTSMQVSYGIIFLALVDRTPKLLNLKEILAHYVSHRKEIVTRRTQYLLNQAEKRAHILEGLKIALDFIDAVIKLIRASQTVEIARQGLMSRFKLTEIQASAILEMRLQKLTSLESKKIIEELNELQKRIKELKDILGSPAKIIGIVKEELSGINKKFGVPRKTELSREGLEVLSFESEDLIENQDEVITLTVGGYVRRVPLDTFRRQQRGGKGVISGGRKEDALRYTRLCQSHDTLLFFSNRGKVFYIKAYELPEMGKDTRGKNIRALLSLIEDEYITTIISVSEFSEDKFLILLTKTGIIKKMELTQIKNARKGGTLAVQFKANEKDYLVDAVVVDEKDEVFLASSYGLGLKTSVSKIRAQGRTASGIIGMNLENNSEMVGIASISSGSDQLLFMTQNGYGKRVKSNEFMSKGRGGKGMKACGTTEKTGKVVAVTTVNENSQGIVTTNSGMTLRVSLNDISLQSRTATGVRVLKLNEGDQVVATSIFDLK